jgi:DNA-binding transcriptional MerR regulator
MKLTKTQYYESIDTLPLWNFDRYKSTKDLNFFVVGYDGRQKKLVNQKLQLLEKSILDEYFKAIDDRSFTAKMQKWVKIDYLKLKYHVVTSLIARMWKGFADDQMDLRLQFIKELASHGFKIPEINTNLGDKEELERLSQGAEGIKTQIHILEKELVKDGNNETISLHRQLQIATLGLNYPYRLNAKEITVSEWIEITKLLEEKSKQN